MKYNTFIIINCKTNKIELVTSSARKASRLFGKGKKAEIWSENQLLDRFNSRTREKRPFLPYIEQEKEYIRQKQQRAERKNNENRSKLSRR